MKKYFGVKKVKAEPMTYADFLSRDAAEGIPESLKANASKAAGYKVVFENDHEIWLPDFVFEENFIEAKPSMKMIIQRKL